MQGDLLLPDESIGHLVILCSCFIQVPQGVNGVGLICWD